MVSMRFSIVTISYNQGRFLEDAIKSVISQRVSGVDVEYIVVDPGSTDDSRQIIEKHSSGINRVLLEPDSGPPEGLNNGFSLATGEVFGFINADDRLEEGSLQAVAEFFTRNENSDALVGALRMIDARGRPLHRSAFHLGATQYPPHYSLHRFLDRTTSFLQPSTCFRRQAWEAVGGFNTKNMVSWDAELFVEMMLHGIEFSRIPRVLAEFRIYPNSISGSAGAARKVKEQSTIVREAILAAGHRPSPRGIAWLRRFAWRLRPVHRIMGWAAGRRSSPEPLDPAI